MTVAVLRADARDLPMPDSSVDLIVTSPPYFGLRSYTDGGEHYDGQIGSEATPQEWLAALLACTREWMRVLKPCGSLWVNLGDKYSTGGSGENGTGKSSLNGHGGEGTARDRHALARSPRVAGLPPKSLLGLPWRYALACIDELGLILRAEVIWSKPNGLPESVTDRVRRSHEQWFHLVMQPRYYSAVDEIRERQMFSGGEGSPNQRRLSGNGVTHREFTSNKADYNPLGKLPGSVWTIPSQPLTVPAHLGVDHFAAFPMEWPRRIIQGWSPPGICTVCGDGRRPVGDKSAAGKFDDTSNWTSEYAYHLGATGRRLGKRPVYQRGVTVAISGYDCACPDVAAPTRPATVLDPFGGTGTTALIADVLGRIGISVDRSHDYTRLAQWRTTDPGQRAAAMQVDKPPAPIDGQLELFG